MRQSDVVTLHTPFSKATKNLIDARRLGADEAARRCSSTAGAAALVDEDALLAALEAGKIAGAGLDVYEDEPTHRHALTGHPQGRRDAAHRRADQRGAGAHRDRDRPHGAGGARRRGAGGGGEPFGQKAGGA